ncbi:hypothetical protein S40288_07607 [Stachybotrys chartarum IBT 40288]|nr:hypothetical protein S40288_07607 [Stachybotrys chartarum IBT 40288]
MEGVGPTTWSKQCLHRKANQIAWKHNALVLLLPTVFICQEFICRIRRWHSAIATSQAIRREFRDEPVKELPMLEAAAAYNYNTGAVDIGDQLPATEGLEHCNLSGSLTGNSLDLPA